MRTRNTHIKRHCLLVSRDLVGSTGIGSRLEKNWHFKWKWWREKEDNNTENTHMWEIFAKINGMKEVNKEWIDGETTLTDVPQAVKSDLPRFSYCFVLLCMCVCSPIYILYMLRRYRWHTHTQTHLSDVGGRGDRELVFLSKKLWLFLFKISQRSSEQTKKNEMYTNENSIVWRFDLAALPFYVAVPFLF